LSKAILTNQWT